MSEQQTIKIVVDQIEVVGQITYRSNSDLNVKITSPYRNISSGSHIAYFARAHRSFEGEYGDQRAQQILGELYNIGLYLHQNMDQLQGQISQFRQEQDINSTLSQAISDEKVRQHKREMRALFRRGEIDQRTYQQQLRQSRQRNLEITIQVWEFFDTICSLQIPAGTKDQALAIIEGQNSLF